MATKCAVESCNEVGGKQHLVNGAWVCDRCYTAPPNRDSAKSTFPFVTSHITGKPMEIQNLRSLRKIENQHGVASGAYN